MDSMGEYCSNTPCKWLQYVGNGGAYDTNAHNLLDEMPSQQEVSKEDLRISEPVPINSTMRKEEKWLDKALDRILEKLEQIEAKCRCGEKIDWILEKLDEIEANRGKSFEETTNIIKATTAVLRAPPSLSPVAPSPLAPTKCSTNCSNPNIVSNLTMAAVVTCAHTSMDSMELEVVENVTCTTDIDIVDSPKETHTKCLMLGLGSNSGADQAMVTFQTLVDMNKGVFAPDATTEVISGRKIPEIDLVIVMPTSCSMLFFDKGASELLPVRGHVMWQLLLEHCK